MSLPAVAHVRHLSYKLTTIALIPRVIPSLSTCSSRHFCRMPISPALGTPDLQYVLPHYVGVMLTLK